LNGKPALRLELGASRGLARALVLAHVAAAVCMLAVLPGATGAGLATLLVALGCVTARDRALLRARRSLRALELQADGRAILELADGSLLPGSVAARRNVNQWWVTLALQGAPHRTVLVVRDMLPAAEFRRLRIWALWGRVPGVAAPQLPA